MRKKKFEFNVSLWYGFYSASHLVSLTNRTRIKLRPSRRSPRAGRVHTVDISSNTGGSLSNTAWQVFGKVLVCLGGKLTQGSSEQHCRWDAFPGTAEFLNAHVIPRSLIRPWDSAPLLGNICFSLLLICYISLGHNSTGKSSLSSTMCKPSITGTSQF